MTNIPNQFDPSIAKKIYTQVEWDAKEAWYANQISTLQLPLAPTTGDIRAFVNRLDMLLPVARLDFSFVTQNYETYDSALKNMEKIMFSEIKLTPPVELQSIKLTVDEAKGYVTNHISKTPYMQTGVSLYEIVRISNQRHIFMEAVVKNLLDKKESVITHMTLNKHDMLGAGASANGAQTGADGAQM